MRQPCLPSVSERGTEFIRIPVSIEYLSISWKYRSHANYLGSKRRNQWNLMGRGEILWNFKNIQFISSGCFHRCILRSRLSKTNWDSINQQKKFPFQVKTVEVNTYISIERDLHWSGGLVRRVAFVARRKHQNHPTDLGPKRYYDHRCAERKAIQKG